MTYTVTSPFSQLKHISQQICSNCMMLLFQSFSSPPHSPATCDRFSTSLNLWTTSDVFLFSSCLAGWTSIAHCPAILLLPHAVHHHILTLRPQKHSKASSDLHFSISSLKTNSPSIVLFLGRKLYYCLLIITSLLNWASTALSHIFMAWLMKLIPSEDGDVQRCALDNQHQHTSFLFLRRPLTFPDCVKVV